MTTTIMIIIAKPTAAAIIPTISPILISSFLPPFLFVILSTENTKLQW